MSRRLVDQEASGELPQELIDDLIDQLVDSHEQASPVAEGSQLGSAESIASIMTREFSLLRARLGAGGDLVCLDRLETLADEAHERLQNTLAARQRDGFVRETHGDIHLGNALLFDGDEPRWNDVACDLAFLLMDLEARDEQVLARHALNRYLELSGDYGLARVLNYYKLYRALVRAKLAAIRSRQADDIGEQQQALVECRGYLSLADGYARFTFPYLLIGVGVSGSGKSRFTGEVILRLGGVRLRSDVERKRLFGFHPQASSRQQGVDIYTSSATRRTYQRLAKLTGLLLESGYPVCIDATCLARWQRDMLAWEAEGRGLPLLTVSFEADEATLRRRIEKRAKRGGAPSEASLTVLARQLASLEPFGVDERRHLIHLDTTADDATETLVSLIQAKVGTLA
ncbi:AAA family ATPase [Halomonas sp. ML-15]|uniref:bifunctional aminoglycoside phosphotransferase/ATP-binding protein n=1 Tax=Halomonas sp. ML-15 TaxID=2773305 RepID=UPI0017473128|nr:bifunctional aminoglycoside phosphotransferase/ATP-binding protein [Halomonas sp. ML-15]MBD3897030.1 AAA family ATPase [Halomonas sp. ML-15]